MFKATWKNLKGLCGGDGGCTFETEQEAQAWLDSLTEKEIIGKKARWLPEFLEGVESREVVTQEEVKELQSVEVSEGVFEEQEVVVQEKISHIEYLWPKEFTVDVKDLSQDYDFLLAQCYERRKKKYGTIEEQMDMMYHGTWKDHIKKVKDEELKPIKE